MIQEVIRSRIEELLNDNTSGKVFVVGSYVYLEDTNKSFVYNIRNGYTLVETNFVPAMMVFVSSYQPIPNQINGSASIPITFLLAGETQTQFESDLEALNEVVAKIVSEPYATLVDGSTTYRSVWNMDALQPGAVRAINGEYYTEIQSTIYVDFSDTNHYGNEYEYYLDGNQVVPYDADTVRANEEYNPHLLGDYEAKGGNATSSWKATMTFYVNDFLSSLVDLLSSNTYDMEMVFNFKETTPTKPEGNEFAVRIADASYKTSLGEKTFVVLTFIKSDTAYSEATYTITYSLDGGTNNASNPASFNFNDMPVALYDPTKDGYTFSGWYGNSSFTGLPLTEISIPANITIYAKWTIIPGYEWVATTETVWEQQDALDNAGTSTATAPATSPDEDANDYALGFAMRVWDGITLPITYHYYKVAESH